MSWLFAGMSLAAAVVSLAVASVVVLRDQRSSVNRVFAVLCLSVSVWAFIQFQARQAPDLATAAFWLRAMAMWPFVEALLLHFILLFTERTRPLHWEFSYPLIYFPAVAIAAIDLTTHWVTGPPIKTYWGWSSVFVGTPVNIAADVYVVLWTGAAIFLAFDYYGRQKHPMMRQRALWVAVGISIPIIVGIATDLVLPRFIVAPEFGPPAAALGIVCCAGWAMWRYQLFSITPASAADRIISTMSDCLLLTDPEGKILTANSATGELLGRPEEELVGTNIEGILPDDNTPGARPVFHSGVAPVEDGETETLWPDTAKGEVPMSLVWSVMRAADGSPMGIVWIARDISERKRLDRIKSDLVAMVSHELRNPLRVIVGKAALAECLIAEGQPDERCLNSVRKVQAEASEMGQIVDNLLDVYRLEMGELRPLLEEVDIVQLLHLQAELLETTRSHLLAFDIAGEIPLVRCDPRRMSIAIGSLLKNAMNFSPDGGTIVVGARREDRNVRITVADQGRGVLHEDRERIFERFERGDLSARKSYRGLGMGLYLVREIMNAHGGSVSVESTPGKGSAFTLHLPIRPAAGRGGKDVE